MSPPEARRVLVADDNAVDRQVLSAIVRKAGYEVIDAVDGEDALAKFYSEKPDLVLLDALMPGKDGFEVAQEIKSNQDDGFVPVIFLTSLTEANELARCLDAGGDDFLSKPYNRVILQAKLNALQRMRDMHHTLQAQRDEISRHHMQLVADQEAAKAVFDNVAHTGRLDADYVQYLISPLSLFNGDVLLAAENPAGDLYLLLGDFTGHGLAAAIGAMPLADVFYGMTSKGFALGEIARECNRKLGAVLPSGTFCCVVMLIIDFNRGTAEFWNGGIPSAYLRRAASGEVVQLTSANLPLGILPAEQFRSETMVAEVAAGDRVLLATDGVIEARDEAGALFGSARLEDIIQRSGGEELFGNVKSGVYEFIGNQGRDDDLTMVEVEVIEPRRDREVKRSFDGQVGGPRDWKFSYELGPASLKEFNPLPLLQQVLMEAPYLRSRASEIYTVMAELYSNALEHGVLGLDSNLKSSASGFAQYYAARSKALETIEGFVRFEMESLIDDNRIELEIKVRDSGAGFDYAARLADQQTRGSSQYHGRGMGLLRKLCESIEYVAPGNQVNVVMRWELANE